MQRTIRIIAAALMTLALLAPSTAMAGTRTVTKGKKVKRVDYTPAQVWALVRKAYLKRDFKTLFAQYCQEDRAKQPFAKFKAKLARFYDQKVDAFRRLKFIPGKAFRDKRGRRMVGFGFALPNGRIKRKAGRMIRDKDGWRLYHFK
jgi:hypothetical protein